MFFIRWIGWGLSCWYQTALWKIQVKYTTKEIQIGPHSIGLSITGKVLLFNQPHAIHNIPNALEQNELEYISLHCSKKIRQLYPILLPSVIYIQHNHVIATRSISIRSPYAECCIFLCYAECGGAPVKSMRVGQFQKRLDLKGVLP